MTEFLIVDGLASIIVFLILGIFYQRIISKVKDLEKRLQQRYDAEKDMRQHEVERLNRRIQTTQEKSEGAERNFAANFGKLMNYLGLHYVHTPEQTEIQKQPKTRKQK